MKRVFNHIAHFFTSSLLARIAVLMLMCITAIVIAPRVQASEGRLVLVNGTVSCEGISVWDRDSYDIRGRCSGLVYPYADRFDEYFLWVQPEGGGTAVRVDEVEEGLFAGKTDRRFTQVFITAEEASTPRTPGTFRIVAGTVQAFDFPTSSRVVAPEPNVTGTATVTQEPTPILDQPEATGGSTFRRIGTILLVIFIIIIAMVIIIPLVFNRPMRP